MKLSQNGLEFLSQNEGFRLRCYLDSVGLPTIGVGHLLTEEEKDSLGININGEIVGWNEGLTEEQVLALLAQDVGRFEEAVNNHGLDLTQNQFDVLVDFAFNCGEGALDQLLSHGVEDVPNQLPKWVKAGGRRDKGLVARRAREVELWLT